jgi:hypothetical protein
MVVSLFLSNSVLTSFSKSRIWYTRDMDKISKLIKSVLFKRLAFVVVVILLAYITFLRIADFGSFFGVSLYDYLPTIKEASPHWIGSTYGQRSHPLGTSRIGVQQLKKESASTFAVSEGYPSYYLSQMWTYRGKQLWLERIEKDGNKYKITVVDGLMYPDKGYLTGWLGQCWSWKPIPGKTNKLDVDKYLIGIVSELSVPLDAVQVWRIDLEKEKFEPVSPLGIKCYMRTYHRFGA